MAFPVILVNSATGSDTAASGAGPATALTGSAASTSGDGLTVTLDGSPDLSGVATDGSHVIFLNDSTAGARNFAKITGKDDGADTVTVSDAFGLSLSGKSWAIGGKRASIGATTSRKLLENNSGAGDVAAGWTIRFESGHSETISSAVSIRASGNYSAGPMVIEGVDGAATMPVIISSGNVTSFNVQASVGKAQGLTIRNLKFTNTSATKTSSYAIYANYEANILVQRCIISDATNYFYRAIGGHNGSGIVMQNCDIGYCANVGVIGGQALRVENCWVHDCGSHGIYPENGAAGGGGYQISHCLIEANTGSGVYWQNGSNFVSGYGSTGCVIEFCTIVGNGGDGIKNNDTGSMTAGQVRVGLLKLRIVNNILADNGGYGLNFAGSVTAEEVAYHNVVISHNDFGTGDTANTSGACNLTISSPFYFSNVELDPAFTDTGSHNFGIGTALKALGWPDDEIGLGQSGTRSYVDIGAAQRIEPTGGGGAPIIGSGIIVPVGASL